MGAFHPDQDERQPPERGVAAAYRSCAAPTESASIALGGLRGVLVFSLRGFDLRAAFLAAFALALLSGKVEARGRPQHDS